MPASTPVDLKYRQFVDFATNAASDRTILRSSQNAGGGFSIHPAPKGEFIGHILRRGGERDANDAIRESFRQNILDMFGVKKAEDLPESVKTAMKLEDYDKGKPLTARRILAVNAVVEKHLAAMTKVLASATSTYTLAANMVGVRHPDFKIDDTVKSRISTALKACKGDDDAIELLKADTFNVLYGNDEWGRGPNLLSKDEVNQKVGIILGNLQSLRQVAGNDTKLYAMLKPFIWSGSDTVYSPPQLRSMITTVDNLDVSGLKRLTSRASAKDIRDVAGKFSKLLADAMQNAQVPHGSDRDDYKRLLAVLIFAKAGLMGSSLGKVRQSLETGPATKLQKYYQDKINALGPFLDRGVGNRMDELKKLKEYIDQCCDGPFCSGRPIEPFNGPVTDRDAGFDDGQQVYKEP